MKKITNLLVLFLLATQFANAMDYYVSASATDDDDDGTDETKAWKTLEHADAMVSAGDVVYVMNGTYDPFTIRTSGSERFGFITYKAYPGHNPKVSCGPSGAWNLVSIVASYIIWDGIEVVGINQSTNLADAEANYDNMVALYAQYAIDSIPISQSEWDKTTSTVLNGITIGETKDSVIENNQAAISNITIKNCYVHDCAGVGIDARNSDNVLIENNVVYNNCWFTMWATSGISAIYQNGYATTTIRGNTVFNNYCQVKWLDKRDYSDGNGIIIDINDGTVHPPYNGYFTVENNLVYDNGGRGLYIMNAQNATFRNNTSYSNSKSWFSTGGEMVVHNSTNVAYINNVAWADNTYYADNFALNDKGAWGTNSNITWQNNLTYNGTAGQSSVNLDRTTTTYIDNSNKLGVNPLLIDPKISGGNFHTSSGSPVINAGTSGYEVSTYDLDYNDRVQGGTIDIGCYEAAFAQTDIFDQPGTLISQGENAPGESRQKAIDNTSGTKWLDFANGNPGTRASWIQYQLSSGKFIVRSYTITSANDAAERDPEAWDLKGSNNGTDWTTIDTKTNQSFLNRLQKNTYTISNTIGYSYYKLQINTVNNPDAANSMQLAEIEMLGTTAALSRPANNAKVFSGTRLNIFPNPVSDGFITIKLAGFNKEKVQLIIFDTQGRLLLRKSLLNESEIHLSTTNILKPGVYFVKVQGKNATIVEKLLVK